MNTIFISSNLAIHIIKYIDNRSLCNTCKLLSQLRKYSYYKLNRHYSYMYYYDVSFRNIVLNQIFNPSKQLYVDLSFEFDITDVRSLGNVHTLVLKYCYSLIDVSALGNVHDLDLSYCRNLKDVSALGNVYKLNLSGCDKITDMSALNITDIIA